MEAGSGTEEGGGAVSTEKAAEPRLTDALPSTPPRTLKLPA